MTSCLARRSQQFFHLLVVLSLTHGAGLCYVNTAKTHDSALFSALNSFCERLSTPLNISLNQCVTGHNRFRIRNVCDDSASGTWGGIHRVEPLGQSHARTRSSAECVIYRLRGQEQARSWLSITRRCLAWPHLRIFQQTNCCKYLRCDSSLLLQKLKFCVG